MSSKAKNRLFSKAHVQQQDEASCGVACLQTILRYFGDRNTSTERLRNLSGTSTTGTTMLGLLQAGRKLGLEIEGFSAELHHLQDCEEVCILHVIKDEQLQHFIIFHHYDEQKDAFYISDPAEDFPRYLTSKELDDIWVSKALLLIKQGKISNKAAQQKTKWQWIKTLVKDDLNLLGLALVLGMAISLLSLSTAIFSQKLLDDFIPNKNSKELIIGLVVLLLLLLFKSGFTAIRQVFLLRQSRDFNIRIINFFFKNLVYLPKPFFDNRKTGDLIARMNDTSRIQQTISAVVGSMIIDVLMIIVATIFIFVYDWQIGIASILWLPIFVTIVCFFNKPILQGQREVMKAHAVNESHYVDTIQGMGTIKVNNQESFFRNLINQIYTYFQIQIYTLGKVGLRFSISTEIVSTLFIVGVIGLSAYHVFSEILTTGGLMAILQMIGLLMTSASSLAVLNIQIQEAKIAFDRMFEYSLIDKEHHNQKSQHELQELSIQSIHAQDVSFRFPGRKSLFSNLNFKVEKGEVLCILGESGSGKSTLAQILQKFLNLESGRILINDQIDLNDISHKQWRSKIGVISQETKIFNTTLLQNIILSDKVEDSQYVEQFLEEKGFNRFFSKFPSGYATLLGEEGQNISGGQKQLVALARALLHDPEVLIFDEPTAALDRDTEHFVFDLLQSIKHAKTTILFTHKLQTAMKADSIGVFERGEIFTTSDKSQLLSHDNLFSRLYRDYTSILRD